MLHHMKDDHGNDYDLFAKRLREQLLPILRHLITVHGVTIVWMQQMQVSPGRIANPHFGIHERNNYAAKIRHYNAGVTNILQ